MRRGTPPPSARRAWLLASSSCCSPSHISSLTLCSPAYAPLPPRAVAEHQLTGHKVAIKILNRHRIKQLDMDEKVRREIKILKLFYHPHIIRLYEVIYTPGDIYMVMEYVSGGELFDFIVSNGRLPEDKARRFFQQILSGIEYCHQHMVVHRDLKPENLLLDADCNLRIADFGLSNVMKDGDFFKTSCGSPNYAAPEVISGKLYAGPEVDVWSMGVILYALLCGSLPFDDENIPNLFKKIKGGIYTLPGHIGEPTKDLIAKMLVVDPLQRITIAEIRQHPWFKVELPMYISMPADQISSEFDRIDEEVLDEVVLKIGFDRDEVTEALRLRERNQMTVAYYLVLDHKRQKILSQQTLDEQQAAAAAAHASTAAPSDGMLLETAEPYLQDGAHLRAGGADGGELGAKKWHLGVQSRMPPADMMLEIFRALRIVHFEWKVVAQYQVVCRPSLKCVDGLILDGDDDAVGKRASVKLGLQLYKVMEDQYLLDVKRLEGDIFPFMDVCSALLCELKL
ncbi:SNF1-related protein kinase [Pavlovales sp. CCMP2436]|nr:SNF1-related protein kinase [Pavlovales sp. CCMP2436]